MQFSNIIFYVTDIQKAVDFYKNAFDIQPRIVRSGRYAELETGTTSISFALEEIGRNHTASEFMACSVKNPPFGFEITLTVPTIEDVRLTYDKAIKAGALPINPPAAKPWGQTIAYVRDPNGIFIDIVSKPS